MFVFTVAFGGGSPALARETPAETASPLVEAAPEPAVEPQPPVKSSEQATDTPGDLTLPPMQTMLATVSTKTFYNLAKFSVAALNVLNAQPRLPAFGEHANNRNGTLRPEGIRVMARMTVAVSP